MLLLGVNILNKGSTVRFKSYYFHIKSKTCQRRKLPKGFKYQCFLGRRGCLARGPEVLNVFIDVEPPSNDAQDDDKRVKLVPNMFEPRFIFTHGHADPNEKIAPDERPNEGE